MKVDSLLNIMLIPGHVSSSQHDFQVKNDSMPRFTLLFEHHSLKNRT